MATTKKSPRAKPALPAAGPLPVQPRAQETVRAIVEAALELIQKHGYEAATTEAICKRAGVGAASLFRYFPDKRALLVAVMEEAWEREAVTLGTVLAEEAAIDPPRPLEGGIHRVVVAAIGTLCRLDRFHRAFSQEIGPYPLDRGYERVQQQLIEAVRQLLVTERAKSAGIHLVEPDVTAFLLVRGLSLSIEAAIVGHPDWIASGRLERAVTEQVTRMILGGRERPAP